MLTPAVFWLIACGVQEPMMQPNPPPGPAPGTKMADPDEVTVSGTVSSFSGETRSWVQVGDGQTVIGHLPATGVLTIDTRTSLPSDLLPGMLIRTHGHQQGDLVVVMDAAATTTGPAASLPAPGSSETDATAAPTPPTPTKAAPAAAAPAAPQPSTSPTTPPAPVSPAPVTPAPSTPVKPG